MHTHTHAHTEEKYISQIGQVAAELLWHPRLLSYYNLPPPQFCNTYYNVYVPLSASGLPNDQSIIKEEEIALMGLQTLEVHVSAQTWMCLGMRRDEVWERRSKTRTSVSRQPEAEVSQNKAQSFVSYWTIQTLASQYCNTQSWEWPGTEVNIVRHALPYRDDLHWSLLQVQSHLFPADLTEVYLIDIQTEMEKRYVRGRPRYTDVNFTKH